jgi:DNA-directed RNA polymerase specialized sigma24 family protein
MLRYPLPHSFKVVEYKEQGKSIREIAKEMGLSRGKVERTLKLGVSKTLETCTL